MSGPWIRCRLVTAALVAAALFAATVLASSESRALTLQAPAGGAPFSLPEDRVVCGQLPEGWTTDSTRRRVRPPADQHPGTPVTLSVAPSVSACTTNAVEHITAILTGPHPVIDPASVAVFVDSARLELRGEGLEGIRIGWKVGERAGSDVCLNVTKDKGRDFCAVNVDKKLPVDPRSMALWWAPPGGHADPDVVTFDKAGNPVPEDQRRLAAGRVVLGPLFPSTRTVDVASGEGHVDLTHPEAVSSADCGAARCEVTPKGIVVRSVPAALTNVAIRLRLLPRVFVAHGEAFDNAPTDTLAVLRCPLSMVSGEPLRGADDLQVVLRFDNTCGRDVDRLRWMANGDVADVVRTESLPDGKYVVLLVGRTSAERLTITASKEDDGTVVAVASERTWQMPPLQTSLVFPNFGAIDFVPKNRDALITVAPVPRTGKLVPVSVPGAYTVTEQKDGYHVRGVYAAGGYTALRFAFRASSLPHVFQDTDLAVLVDPTQHPIREASLPAPLGASSVSKFPIIELFCAFKDGHVRSIPSGSAPHVPFSRRDSCFLVVHRNRISMEDGEQRVDLDVSVSTVSGTDRSEAKLSEHLVLRHGSERDVIWVRGAKEQFDKINIRVTHVIDETQYIGRSTDRVNLPSAQWTVVTEDARFRFYATAAIPTSLFRFSNDPQDLGTGPLILNFGMLSRLTWIDSEGHEGLIGLEAGLMGMGLAEEKDRQLAAVTGLGISIPIGNVNQPTQASVNIHAWGAYTFGAREGNLKDDNGVVTNNKVSLNPWGFVFGPSITIGNIGTFL